MNFAYVLEYERMMRDSVRMRAYQNAIAQVCPDKTVCEIGVGMGALSLMALKAGARRVYGIEVLPDALQFAERLMKLNGFDKSRFVPITGFSTEVGLPEQVDVILTEMVDSTGIGEDIDYCMLDARKRFLAPGGLFLPQSLKGYVALVKSTSFEETYEFWARGLSKDYNLDYSLILKDLRSTNSRIHASVDEIFSKWVDWVAVDFSKPPVAAHKRPVLLRAERAGIINGVCLAFELTLIDGIQIRTFPEDAPTHWGQGFCPLPEPVDCKRGDALWTKIRLITENTSGDRISVSATVVPADNIEGFLSK